MFDKKRIILSSVVGALILFAIIVFFSLMVTVKQGHVGVIYNRNGGVEQHTLSQGTHFIAPWKTVTQYPVALETVHYKSIKLTTKDGKPLSIDVTFNYSNDPSKVVSIFNRFKGASPSVIEDTFLRSRMKQASLSVTSQYSILEIFQNRDEIQQKISKKFEADVKRYGFIVTGFVLGTPTPDKNTEAAIQRVVNAQQDLQALKVEGKKAKQEAENKTIQAQGDANAMIIRAKAEAKANEIINKSLTPNLIKSQTVKKWDGKMPSTYVDGQGGGMILNPASSK